MIALKMCYLALLNLKLFLDFMCLFDYLIGFEHLMSRTRCYSLNGVKRVKTEHLVATKRKKEAFGKEAQCLGTAQGTALSTQDPRAPFHAMSQCCLQCHDVSKYVHANLRQASRHYHNYYKIASIDQVILSLIPTTSFLFSP